MNLSPNFILLPLTILFIVIVIRFIVPIIRTKTSGLITWKRSFIFAGFYLGVLILMVPMLYLLPQGGFSKSIGDRNQDETISSNVITDLTKYLPLRGDFDKQKGLYKNSSHTFKVDTKKLAFNRPANEIEPIFVERKNVDDGEIEVYTYVTAHLAGNIDFTKLIYPPEISYVDGTLSIGSASHQMLDFKRFNVDFTVAQFKNKDMGVENGMSSSFGLKIIYIRVPKSLELDKGKYSDQIQLIGGR